MAQAGSYFVITDPCIGTCDTACVDVCPVDCIHGPLPVAEVRAVPAEERRARWPAMQLYINPNECIDCWGCVAACPVAAIYRADQVPEKWRASIEANARFFEDG
jgi:ferredoxin